MISFGTVFLELVFGYLPEPPRPGEEVFTLTRVDSGSVLKCGPGALLERIRLDGPLSRADLARVSSLSKPTVSLALANPERAASTSGLSSCAARSPTCPARSALGRHARRSRPACPAASRNSSGSPTTSARAGISRSTVPQTVIGSPGVYDPGGDAMTLPGGLPGLNRPAALAGLREAAARGDERASAVVAEEARLVASAICCLVTPVMPAVRVSALGTEAVVDGCLAEGAGLAWQQLTSTLIGG